MIARIAVASAVFSMDKPFDYRIPDSLTLQPGQRVRVPFGASNRRTVGIVLAVMPDGAERPDGPALKPVEAALDPEPLLSRAALHLAAFVRERYFCTFYDAVRAILPAGVWFQPRDRYTLAENAAWDDRWRNPAAQAVFQTLQTLGGLERTGLTPDLVNLVEDTSHAGAAALMTATGYIDLLIPRGGAGLIRACVEHATVPCIQTGTGICHVYVDESADLDMALDIIENAKTSRPSVCNAAEVLLVHRAAAPKFLPMLQKRLCGPGAKHPVRLHCDEEAAAILGIAPDPEFDTEFLDYVLAVGVVDGVEGAIRHIAQHSTHHSEAIVTQSEESAARFTAGVDSAAVYVNASTRFTDGGEFGLGCEMGISTQKLHARGPIGLNELTTYQYVITGNGQIRR